jgi:hypothetical protein
MSGLDQEPDPAYHAGGVPDHDAVRLLQLRLDERLGESWWLHPPWNPHKTRPSVLDLERFLRQHRAAIQQGLSDWLAESEKTADAAVEAMAM